MRVLKDQKENLDEVWDSSRDQIGWLVPAIPTPDNETFWGYTSVPSHSVVWWWSVPLRKEITLESMQKHLNDMEIIAYQMAEAAEFWHDRSDRAEEKLREFTHSSHPKENTSG